MELTIKQGRGETPLPKNLILISFLVVLFLGGVMLFTNGVEPRMQRYVNLEMAVVFLMATWFIKINFGISLLFYYLCFHIYQHPFLSDLIYPIILFAIIYALLIKNYDSWKDKKNFIYDIICLIAILNVIWQVLQWFGIYWITFPIRDDFMRLRTGLMSNINETSVLLAICAPAFFRRNRFFLLPVVLLGLALAKSFIGFVGLTAILVSFSLFMFHDTKFKLFLCSTIILSFFIGAYFLKDFNWEVQKSHRFRAWGYALQLSIVKPLGWGIGQFGSVFPFITSFSYLDEQSRGKLFQNIEDKPSAINAMSFIIKKHNGFFDKKNQVGEAFLQAHNEYVEWLFNAGIIGLILGVYILSIHLLNGIKLLDLIPFYGLLGASVTAMGFFTWQLVPMALITVFYMGIIQAEAKHGNFRIV